MIGAIQIPPASLATNFATHREVWSQPVAELDRDTLFVEQEDDFLDAVE